MKSPHLVTGFIIAFAITPLVWAVDVDVIGDRAINVFIKAKSQSKVDGVLSFSSNKDQLHIKGQISGLKAGSTHGIHIHEKGDCSAADASSAGGHFEGKTSHHGGPHSKVHHAGDLGNFTANKEGIIEIDQTMKGLKLYPTKDPLSVWGRAFVVHQGKDDLKSQPSGNSGKRIGCGVIRIEESKKN